MSVCVREKKKRQRQAEKWKGMIENYREPSREGPKRLIDKENRKVTHAIYRSSYLSNHRSIGLSFAFLFFGLQQIDFLRFTFCISHYTYTIYLSGYRAVCLHALPDQNQDSGRKEVPQTLPFGDEGEYTYH